MCLSSSIFAVFSIKQLVHPSVATTQLTRSYLYMTVTHWSFCFLLLYPQDKHYPSSSEMKHEINATMMTLPTEQKGCERDEFSPSTLERGNEDVVALKEEIATLKTDLEEKQVQLKV